MITRTMIRIRIRLGLSPALAERKVFVVLCRELIQYVQSFFMLWSTDSNSPCLVLRSFSIELIHCNIGIKIVQQKRDHTNLKKAMFYLEKVPIWLLDSIRI